MEDKSLIESSEKLLRQGEAICRSHDWHWVAIWAYSIHNLFRNRMQPRKVWEDIDALIRVECDWHLGKDLFHRIRQITLVLEKEKGNEIEHNYLLLGEVTAKSISNASWSPGLFDLDAPWRVPVLAAQIARGLGDAKLFDFLHHHLSSLAHL